MRRLAQFAVPLALLLGAVACSSEPETTSSVHARAAVQASASASASMTTLPSGLLTSGSDITGTITIASHSIRLEPAAGETAAVSADAAVAVAKTSGLYPNAMATVAPAVKLAVLYDGQTGTIQTDGSVKPAYAGVLVWVISYAGIPDELGPFGNGPGTSSATPTAAESSSSAARADLVVFVNANTGAFLTAINDGVPAPGATPPSSSVSLGPDGKPVNPTG